MRTQWRNKIWFICVYFFFLCVGYSPNEDELSRTIVEAQVETSRFLENHSKIIGAARAESDISVVTKTEHLCRPSNLR